jgi:alpha-1,2-mannosyltransferase
VFQVVAAFGALVLTLGVYARSGFGTLAEIASDSMQVHVDFEIWWRSAAALLDGENIYRNTGAPASSLNLPFWTVMITLFVLFEPLTAYRLFVLMSVAIVVGYLAWITGELSLDARRTALGTVALLLSAPLISTLILLGQVYPFLALLRPRRRPHPRLFRQRR